MMFSLARLVYPTIPYFSTSVHSGGCRSRTRGPSLASWQILELRPLAPAGRVAAVLADTPHSDEDHDDGEDESAYGVHYLTVLRLSILTVIVPPFGRSAFACDGVR